jgi:hypothetical protein
MKSARAERTALFCLHCSFLTLTAGLFVGRPLQACTLWGAAGELVAGGGTLVAKNRDWPPDHRQDAEHRSSEGGLRLRRAHRDRRRRARHQGGRQRKRARHRQPQRQARCRPRIAGGPSGKRAASPISSPGAPAWRSSCGRSTCWIARCSTCSAIPRRSPSLKSRPTAAAPSRARTPARCTTRTTTSPSPPRGSHAGPSASSQNPFQNASRSCSRAPHRPYTAEEFIGFSEDRACGARQQHLAQRQRPLQTPDAGRMDRVGPHRRQPAALHQARRPRRGRACVPPRRRGRAASAGPRRSRWGRGPLRAPGAAAPLPRPHASPLRASGPLTTAAPVARMAASAAAVVSGATPRQSGSTTVTRKPAATASRAVAFTQ